MSKFANTFFKSLNEELEKEGNAFTKGLANTPKGGKFKVGDKEVKDTSNYDGFKLKGKKPKQLKFKLKENLDMEAAPVNPSTEGEVSMDDPEGEIAAYQKTLDKGTDPKAFDTPDNPQLEIDASGIEACKKWIEELKKMADFVNGTNISSLNSQINQLELKNSVPFRGLVRREEKRIVKVAENLSGLIQVFQGVINSSEKKIKDASAPR
jgi:hypothetical protein